MRIIESPSGAERRACAVAALAALERDARALVIAFERAVADDIVHELTRVHGGRFGVERMSLLQLAARLATERLATRQLAPATGLGVEAVAARVAFDAGTAGEIPRLEPVRGYPGFARALARTLTEIRLADLGPEEIAASGGTAAVEISRLSVRYRIALEEASIVDRAGLLGLAVEALDDPRHAALVTSPLVICDVPLRSVLDARFLRALVERAPEVVATLSTGDERTRDLLVGDGSELEHLAGTDVESSLSRVRRFLFEEDRPAEPAIDERVEIFSAPGEGRECVEIARQVLARAADGVPFDEIAVFLRSPETYTPLLETALERANVPAHFARGTRRPDPSGRAFLALLACAAEQLSARRFAEYLSFNQVPPLDDSGAPPLDRERFTPSRDESVSTGAGRVVQLSLFDLSPPDEPPAADPTPEEPAPGGALRSPWKWESYLIEASVIGRRDRWASRLSGYASEIELKLRAAAAEDPDGPRVTALTRERRNLEHLRRFALPLITVLDELAEAESWGVWLARLRSLAPMALRHPERVLSVLAELEPMAAVGPIEIAEVREVLTERLATLEKDPPSSRYGRVFVATPEQARGRRFRHVFVPGLAERVFPRRPREDPLLLDAERARIGDRLARLDERTQDERLLLRLATGAATEGLVISYPRLDVIESRPRVPSFYALDVMAATQGALPEFEELEREAANAANARLSWPAPPSPEAAIDAMEHDLAVLDSLIRARERGEETDGGARYLIDLNAHLERSLRWVYLREKGPTWYPADGIVRATEQTKPMLERHRPAARAYSATALQRFAACPYRFLLSSIHRLEPRPDPAPLIRMDPLTKGQMFHEIQARTLSTLRAGELLPVTKRNLPNALAALADAVAAVEREFRERLAPAIARVWDDEVARLAGDLRIWLRRMTSESGEWTPIHFELAFGLGDRGSHATRDPESSRKEVSVAGGYPLRGAVDLVEASTTSDALRVTDHKTGVNRTQEGMITGGGEWLQPTLYALAVEALLSRPVSQSRLYFATSRGGYSERVVHMDDRARLLIREALEQIDESVSQGRLPPAPLVDGRSRRVACDWCDFLSVCGTRENERTRRKDVKMLQHLRAVREIS